MEIYDGEAIHRVSLGTAKVLTYLWEHREEMGTNRDVVAKELVPSGLTERQVRGILTRCQRRGWIVSHNFGYLWVLTLKGQVAAINATKLKLGK